MTPIKFGSSGYVQSSLVPVEKIHAIVSEKDGGMFVLIDGDVRVNIDGFTIQVFEELYLRAKFDELKSPGYWTADGGKVHRVTI